MNIIVVSTCNKDGWETTGRRMAETFSRFWPKAARLVVYAEGFDVDVPCEQRPLPKWFETWKAERRRVPAYTGLDPRRNRRGRAYDYRYDCVRFAHKIAAITSAGERMTDGLLVWMDADILTHAPVTEAWLEQLHPHKNNYLAWLDRQRIYPECGFLMFRADHPAHATFMHRLRYVYETDQALGLQETHDSFVIQWLVNASVRDRLFPVPHSLSGLARRSHHPFVHSRLGECMDHAKGTGRKNAGRTPAEEVRRMEPYWREQQ